MRTLFRTLTFYALGTFVTLVGFFMVIELTTRAVSWMRGDGFGLALHELDATDGAVTNIYQFHPFAGFTFKPNQKFSAGHPGQSEIVEIRTDEYGFLSDAGSLPIDKEADEIRIATIGASTTANINLSYADNWPGLSLSGIFHGIEYYNGLLKKRASERNTGWVDSANLIPHVDKYFVDRVHFSRAGAVRMAQNMLPAALI